MSFCYRRMTLFSCKCKLMLMVMVNKRRTLVPLLPENARGEFGVWFLVFWCLVTGLLFGSLERARPLKETKNSLKPERKWH